jgi:hypothetical protein
MEDSWGQQWAKTNVVTGKNVANLLWVTEMLTTAFTSQFTRIGIALGNSVHSTALFGKAAFFSWLRNRQRRWVVASKEASNSIHAQLVHFGAVIVVEAIAL